MGNTDLQLIMAALEAHRREQREDLSDFKADMRVQVGKYVGLVEQHEKRFQGFDAIVMAGKTVAAGVTAFVAAVWAVFEFVWSK